MALMPIPMQGNKVYIENISLKKWAMDYEN